MSITNIPSSTTTTTSTQTTARGKRGAGSGPGATQSNKRPRVESNTDNQSVISLSRTERYTSLGMGYQIPSDNPEIKHKKPKTKTHGRRGSNTTASNNSNAASSAFARTIPSTASSSSQNSTLEGRTLEAGQVRMPLALQPVEENGYSYSNTELLIGQIYLDQNNFAEALKHFNNIPPEQISYYQEAQVKKLQLAAAMNNSSQNPTHTTSIIPTHAAIAQQLNQPIPPYAVSFSEEHFTPQWGESVLSLFPSFQPKPVVKANGTQQNDQ